MAQQINVVIFDCDGTLVDSERITLGVLGVPTLRPFVDRRKATRRPTFVPAYIGRAARKQTQ